jgi:hypothetical protein
MLFTAYAVHLLVDALRSGCAPVLPVGRYRRGSNPFNYWLAILCLVMFVYMGIFTLVQLFRDLAPAG